MVDWHWGEERLAVTAGRLPGRTVVAVRQRLITRGEPSAATRGRQTLQAVADATGYDWHDIERAMRGSGIRPVRTGDTPRGRRHLLSEEQVDAVVAHLGRETAAQVAASRTVSSCAHEARRSRQTAYAWVLRLDLVLLPQRRGLVLPDALFLVAQLKASPTRPPEGSRLTVVAVAEASGVGRAWAYRVAARMGLVTGRDATLAPRDAQRLRGALG